MLHAACDWERPCSGAHITLRYDSGVGLTSGLGQTLPNTLTCETAVSRQLITPPLSILNTVFFELNFLPSSSLLAHLSSAG